jgi:hypothetical protein
LRRKGHKRADDGWKRKKESRAPPFHLSCAGPKELCGGELFDSRTADATASSAHSKYQYARRQAVKAGGDFVSEAAALMPGMWKLTDRSRQKSQFH